jgi:hypothetical protein
VVGALPAEQRQVIYVRLVVHLARTRPRAVLPNRAQRASDSLGRGSFQCDLDRARWSLRFALLQASRIDA